MIRSFLEPRLIEPWPDFLRNIQIKVQWEAWQNLIKHNNLFSKGDDAFCTTAEFLRLSGTPMADVTEKLIVYAAMYLRGTSLLSGDDHESKKQKLA